MKPAELIALLRKMPKNSDVVLVDYDEENKKTIYVDVHAVVKFGNLTVISTDG